METQPSLHAGHRSLFNLAAGLIIAASIISAIYRSATAVTITPRPVATQPTQPTKSQNRLEPAAATSTEYSVPPPAPAPKYKLTPVSAVEGPQRDYTLTVQQCFRASERINCWGYVTNTTDATLGFHLSLPGTFFDDEGNTSWVDGTLRYPVRLIPDVPVKFELEINDSHRAVKSVSLQFGTAAGGDTFQSVHYDHLTFKNIPVQ